MSLKYFKILVILSFLKNWILQQFMKISNLKKTIKSKFSTHGKQEIARLQPGHVGHPARVDIVQILQRRTARRRLQLHQRGRRLGPAQDKPKATLGPVQHHGPRFSGGPEITRILMLRSFLEDLGISYAFFVRGAV